MLTCVIGLPTWAYTGLAFISTVDFEAAADAWSALGAATRSVLDGVASASVLAGTAGAGFAGLSLVPDLCGMFLISLYFA